MKWAKKTRTGTRMATEYTLKLQIASMKLVAIDMLDKRGNNRRRGGEEYYIENGTWNCHETNVASRGANGCTLVSVTSTAFWSRNPVKASKT